MKNDNAYERPYAIREMGEKLSPIELKKIKNDPVHLWRAKTGIELIHKEPSLKEQKRIWKNWNKMPSQMKTKSDLKSLKFFGKTNKMHHKEIIEEFKGAKDKINHTFPF